MSRPPLQGDQRRREQICALFTEEEKRRICQIAERKQLQPAVYVRLVVLAATETVAAA